MRNYFYSERKNNFEKFRTPFSQEFLKDFSDA